MKRIRYYIVIYIFAIVLVFILPNIFVKEKIMPSRMKNDNSVMENNIYDFEESKNINVLLTDTNEIVDMGLEEYIKGVVSAEMPASYEMEALKAQAVVARTYALNKILEHKNSGNTLHPQADICTNSGHCQAYLDKESRIKKWNDKGEVGLQLWDKIEQAVLSTTGQIITYNSQPIKAFFHANSGGKTEDVELVWGGDEITYLKSVETSGESNYNQYSSSVMFTYKEFKEIMKEKYPIFEIDFSNNNCICIEQRSDSDRVQKIKIGNVTISGTDARKIFGLKSTNFEFEILEDKIKFYVIGYGHGVGMSQTGANELAKNGYDYIKIIHHYYTNVDIINME